MKKINKKHIEDVFALTPLQEGMLFHYLKDPGSDVYFEQLCLRISGRLELAIFEAAWNFVVETNEMLRTVFRWERIQHPTQVVLKEHKLKIRFYDFSGDGNNDEENLLKFAEIKEQDRRDRFDLRDFPFRVTLCRFKTDRYEMIISNHHILYDGWSNGIILKEFFTAYEELAKGKKPVKPGKSRFKEFVNRIMEQDQACQGKFWGTYLQGFAAAAELPVKKTVKKQGTAIQHQKIELSIDDVDKIAGFAKKFKVTAASLFYSVYGLLLLKYHNKNETMFGFTAAGRSANIKGIEDIVGLFINTLPMRVLSEPGESAMSLLQQVSNGLQRIKEYETTPLVDVKRYSQLESSDELFDSIVVIENYPLDNLLAERGSGQFVIDSFSNFEMTHYDLTLSIMLSSGIDVNFIYNPAVFEHAVIEKLSQHFANVLKGILRDPHMKVRAIDILTEEEREKLLFTFNDTAAQYAEAKLIPELFEEQAARTPDNIALFAAEGVSLTYRQLQERTGCLAEFLKNKGVGHGSITGIIMERSIEMVSAIFAVLKAGGAYLPLLPEYPEERKGYIIRDSGVKLVLTTRAVYDYSGFPGVETIYIDEEINSVGYSSRDLIHQTHGTVHLAYIIYTSGSTGNPKGVVVEHRSVVNILSDLQKKYPLNEPDTYLFKTSYVFDVSVAELFGWFFAGGRLCILQKGAEKNPADIIAAIGKRNVTHINFVPSMFNAFIDALNTRNICELSSLKYIFLAGEALSAELVDRFGRFRTGITLENIYGPTEGTVYSSHYSLSCRQAGAGIPIGKPMQNVGLYILDKEGCLQPIGIPGELCIVGAGVAAGYLNRPELTAEKFINGEEISNLRLQTGKRSTFELPTYKLLYKTGDLARWLPDGNIEYLGRMDFQVKIRGFRIELGEIESRLLQHEAIKETVVVARQDKAGDQYLCAYIVAKDTEPTEVNLRQFLALTLPGYMIPSYFVQIAELPLTPTGKIERKALPAPEVKSGREYTAPRNQREARLVKIWAAVLDIDRAAVGIDDHFFESGGHSLKVTRLVGRIHKEFDREVPFSEIFKRPTIRGLADYLHRMEESRYSVIKPARDKEHYPLTPAQKRLYAQQQVDNHSRLYNMPGIMKVNGNLDQQKVEQTFLKLIDRHESLRTSFFIKDGEPRQRLHRYEDIEFKIEQFSSTRDSLNTINRLIDQFIRSFDLSQAPLLRVGLIKCANAGEAGHILMVDTHHIAADGVSVNILTREFMELYKGENLPGLNLSFKDYADWLSRPDALRLAALERQKDFWLQEIGADVPVLDLPIDYKRPQMPSFAGDTVRFEIADEELEILQAMALTEGSSLVVVLLAAYMLFLQKICNQEEVILGTPTAGRGHNDLEGIVGMFVNTVVLRSEPGRQKRFHEFLREVNERILAAFNNQDLQYEELVDLLGITRETGRNPLFDALFVMQELHVSRLEIPGLKFELYPYENATSKFDLILHYMKDGERTWFKFEYSTQLFKRTTIERFTGYFREIVQAIASGMDARFAEIDILSGAEKRQLLVDFNDTEAEYPADKTLAQIFSRQVEQTPDRVALTIPGAGHSLTYRQLDNQAGRLAGKLIARGIGPGSIAALLLERSVEMMTGILGVLQSGACYLPMESTFPAERITYMLSDSAARILLTSRSMTESVGKLKVGKLGVSQLEGEKLDSQGPGKGGSLQFESIFIDEGISVGAQCAVTGPTPGSSNGGQPQGLPLQFSTSNLPGDPAYIIYTSGTTGRPKGVLIEHGNVVRLLFNERNLFDFTKEDVWTLFHSYCFDFSVWEMYGALLHGGKLVVIDRLASKDPGSYRQELLQQKVTVVNQTPSAFYNLINEDLRYPARMPHVRYVIFGGEALNPLRLKDWAAQYPGVKLINMFGITETTVHVTYKEIGAREIELNISNIGTPIPTLCTYIMDNNLKLLPTGTAGELCVGGAGVGRGYLNKPELTAEKFVENPYKPGEMLYRSGDLARLFANGEMEYLGRIDQQVQIRGFRVELAEIETQLLSHERIKEAVVIVREDRNNEKYICAYIVAQDLASQPTPSDLRLYLSQTLPDYMLPSYFVELEKIPLTSNGKVDRRQLPEPDGIPLTGSDFSPPCSHTEKRMVGIWQQVLDLERVGIKDSFFNVGGDSIKAIRLISAINDELDTDIKIKDLYAAQTIEELAGIVERSRGYGKNELDAVEQEIGHLKQNVLSTGIFTGNADIEDIYPMSDIEKGLVFYYLKNRDVMVYHDQFAYPMKFADFDVALFKQAMNLLVEKHQILRTGFNVEDFAEPVQIVYRRVAFHLPHFDISHLDRQQQEAYIINYLAEDKKHPFDAAAAPLFRMAVFILDNENIFLVLIFHHAVLDGWSAASLITELHNTYRDLRSNSELKLNALKSSYRDVIVEEMIEKAKTGNRDFWQRELSGYKRLEFPRVLHCEKNFSGMRTFDYDLSPELLSNLEKIAGHFHTSLKDLCFAAYVYVLSMLCNEDDIVVGSVSNNRPQQQDGDKVLGCFLNTVPVRIRIPLPIAWGDYIRMISDRLVEIKKYERVSLFEIARVIGEKSQEQNPIFDSLFNFMNFHIYFNADSDYVYRQESVKPPFAVKGNQDTNTLFDFEVSITFGKFFLCPKYNYLAISHEMVHRSCLYFERILRKFIDEPHTIARKQDIVPDTERRHLLFDLNDTAAPFDRNNLMHRLFEEQAEKRPDAVAVTGLTPYMDGGSPGNPDSADSGFLYGCLSYGELNKRANQLARILQQHGLQAVDLAAVIIDRSVEMIYAVMGILKAGGAYVPLEPYLPDTRIRKLLESLNVKYGVTNHLQLAKVCRISGECPELHHILCLTPGDESRVIVPELPRGKRVILPGQIGETPAANQAATATAEDMAYIIFTSGSTGTPKGVVVRHKPVINLIEWVNTTFEMGPADKIIFVSSLGFDLSVYDIFGILAAGACCRVVPHGDLKEPRKLLDIIVTEGISFWDSAPAALQQTAPFLPEIDDSAQPCCFRLVFLSGDWIPVTLPDALRDTFAGLQVISLGGATEATVWSNYYPIAAVKPEWVSIPYGKPIQNASYYILDARLDTCPFFVPGDLYIGGECLASGYINDVELSAAKFIDNPFVPGEKMYRTGDMARWFLDGNMEFLGRKDQQVKIRGYRIELGEIESQLQHHEEIKEAIVLSLGEKAADHYLCAYIVCDRELDAVDLKEYLLKELPEYMIPKYFMRIEKIPITANGKVDRKALPEPGITLSPGSIRVPVDEVGKKLARLWSEVLGIAAGQIGIESDFFELGGHSLNATVLASKIHKAFDVKIPLMELFRSPTITGLSLIIKGAETEHFTSINPVEKHEYYRLSSAQKRIFFLQQYDRQSTLYNMPGVYEAQGNLDEQRLEGTFRRLTERHESLRTAFTVLSGEPIQKIYNSEDAGFNISYLKSGNIREAIDDFIHPFDLSVVPLLRAGLIKIEEGRHILMVDMPHIVSDGMSTVVLIKEFMSLYAGETLPLPMIRYKDFSQWQNDNKKKEVMKAQEDYWKRTLKRDLPVLNLPCDYPGSGEPDFAGSTIYSEINEEEVGVLRNLAREEEVTLFMLFLALYNILLSKISRQEDILVGTPLGGRRHADLQDTIGMFVNTLVLRNFPVKGKRFDEFLEELKEATLKAFENQDYQFEDLVESLAVEVAPGRNPIFDVMFALQNVDIPKIEIPGLTLTDYPFETHTAKFDMMWIFEEQGETIKFLVEYKTKLFSPETIKRFITYFKEIVSKVVENREVLLKDIKISHELLIAAVKQKEIEFEF